MTDEAPLKQALNYRHSLAFRVCLLMIGMTLLVYAVVCTSFITFERQKIKRDIDRNGETFATLSAASIYADYSQFYTHPADSDFENFRTNTQETLARNQDIKHVQMISLSGRVLFTSDEFSSGKYAGTSIRSTEDPALRAAVAKNEPSTLVTNYNGTQVTMIVVPLRETGGGHFLSMSYVLSYDSLSAQLTRSIMQLSWILIVLLIIIGIGALFFALSLVRPITRLTTVAERLRGGNLDARASITSSDEVGRLALTFNGMADQIKLNIAKIEEQNSTLRLDKLQLRASINSLDIGFIMTDHTNEVALLNAEAERVLAYTITDEGVSKSEHVRHDWTTSTIDQTLSGSFNFQETLTKVRSTNSVIQRNDVAFNGRILRIFVAPIIDSSLEQATQVLGTVILLEDITEQKVLERSKDEFFSIASHELRTPLTAIRGNASMIQTYYTEQMEDESLKELVGDIHDSSIRLIGIVNDFLDVSSAEQGKMRYEFDAFNVDEVVESVIYETSASYREKGVTITSKNTTPGQLPQAYADKNRVKQVIYNLVGNAAKFTPPHGTVTVTLEAEKDYLKVSIKDTGAGIEPKAQRLLFHKFQQAGASLYTRRTERGTGLGLYISKLLVEQMNGVIRLDSSIEGKGSTFSFTIPIFNGQKPMKVEDDGFKDPDLPTDKTPKK